jgi:hypothetical protein
VNRGEILREAEALTYGPRNDAYDHPRPNHERIAAGWSLILQTDVSPGQVALCMAWLKIARTIGNASPTNADHYIDGAAYFSIAGELMTEGNNP